MERATSRTEGKSKARGGQGCRAPGYRHKSRWKDQKSSEHGLRSEAPLQGADPQIWFHRDKAARRSVRKSQAALGRKIVFWTSDGNPDIPARVRMGGV
jgi:hypothetical protein